METKTLILIFGFVVFGAAGLAVVGFGNSGPALPAAIGAPGGTDTAPAAKKPNFYALGKSAYENGNFPAAIEYLGRALKTDGCPDDALMYIGRSFCKRERQVEGIESFKKYAKLHPEDASPIAATGTAFYMQAFIERPPLKDFLAASEKEYAAALAKDTGNIEALLGLGNIRLEEKDYHRAETYFENALLFKPDNVQVHRALFKLYSETGDAAKRDAELKILEGRK